MPHPRPGGYRRTARRRTPACAARLVRRDLAATAGLLARSIDRHLAQRDLKTSRAAPVTSKGDHAG